MKNRYFLLGLLSITISAQVSKSKLLSDFEKSKQANYLKFDQIYSSATGKMDQTEIQNQKANLSSFVGNQPVFLHSNDASGNRSANLTTLQDGSMIGLNGNAIDGSGINIMVMDQGQIFWKHNEFGGPTTSPTRVFDQEGGASNFVVHSTQVAGTIGASGTSASAKGVLAKAILNGYYYSTVTDNTKPNYNLDLYQKIVKSNATISNHSYGTTVGWFKVSTSGGVYPAAGWYWYGNYVLNSLDTYSGAYHAEDQSYDKIVYTNPNQIIIKTAGNDYGTGPDGVLPNYRWDPTISKYVQFVSGDTVPAKNCSKGYNCLGFGSVAKNIIIVGASNQLTTANNAYTAPSDIVKYSLGSVGPRKDGAIKPDITAVGTNVYTAAFQNSTTYDTYFSGASGTSYAAPIITGIVGALTQVNRIVTNNASFNYNADDIKALLAHTAAEAGSATGPDCVFGWGFADAKAAAQVIIDKISNSSIFERDVLISGAAFKKEITASSQPLKATISWIDPAAVPFTSDTDLQNNQASRLINDLDLRIIDTVDGTIYYPWKLDANNPLNPATKGDNTVDNIEQVIIDTPVSGRTYRIEVSNKGNLVNDSGVSSNQNFALVTTGFATTSLGTDTIKKENIKIYPTRTKDIVTIINPYKAKEISVYDLSGKKVKSITPESISNVDLSTLPKGVYIVNVIMDNQKISQKIIKE